MCAVDDDEPMNEMTTQPAYSSAAHEPTGEPAMTTPAHLARPRAEDPAMALVDLAGSICFCSPSLGRLVGAHSQTLEGCAISDVLPALPLRPQTAAFNLAFATYWATQGEPLAINASARGGAKPVEVWLRLLHLQGMVLIMVSVSPRSAADDQDLSRFMARAMTRSESIMVTDNAGNIVFTNPRFEEVTGYRAADAVGQRADVLCSGQHEPAFYQRLWSALRAGEEVVAAFTNRKRDGSLYQEYTQLRPFVDHGGQITHFISVGHSITEPLRTAMFNLQHEAYYDPLTRLADRLLFQDRMQQAMARAQRHQQQCALIYLDIDRFKAINDQFGHAAGDRALLSVASCLLSAVRSEDTVARLGGDEFALILHTVRRREDVRRTCEQVLGALGETHADNRYPSPIRASIGVSLYPDDGDTIEALQQKADSAMYAAKAAGGNQLLFATPDA